MRTEVFGTGDDLVFVLGWGNTPEQETVRWLIDRLVERDYRVHAVEIPITIRDFESEYVAPVAEYVASLSSYRVLSHSTGGLIAPALDDPETRVYLSPWWGIHDDQDGILARLLSRLPIARQIVPTGFDADALGDLAADERAEGPDGIAPTLLREVRRAQATLPAFDDDAVVFFSPQDRIVSPTAIRERVPDANRIAYDGGHELFSSSVRTEYLPMLRDAIASGVDGL